MAGNGGYRANWISQPGFFCQNNRHPETSGRRVDLAAFLEHAKLAGFTPTWQEAQEFLSTWGRGGPILVPPFVTRFLSLYFAKKGAQNILHPWAGIGSLLTPIVKEAGIPAGVGTVHSKADMEIAQVLGEDTPIVWRLAESGKDASQAGEFDVVVCAPPLGLRPVSEEIRSGSKTAQVRGSETNVIVLRGSSQLSSDGEAAFLLPNNFFFSQQAGGVREAMPAMGLHIGAIIALPAGAFAPLTAMELSLVFLSRSAADTVFVGQLSPDRDPAPLLKNLAKRQEGAAPELGRLVQFGDYRGWNSLVAAEEQQRLAERSGLVATPIADLVTAVNLGHQTEDGGFENLPNCVYLPLIGSSSAVTSLSALRIKPQNYAQLVIRGESTSADFLAG